MSNKRTQVASVAFSIDGQAIAEHARGLVLCGQWRDGLAMLVEDCGEMTYEIALSILKGEKTLTGNSSTGTFLADVAPDDQTVSSYLGNAQYMFAGLWSVNGKVYQPYARVRSFDEHDLQWSAERFDPSWNSKRSFAVPFDVLRGRVLYYAHDVENDLATIDLGGVSKYMTVHDEDSTFVHPSVRGGYLWRQVSDYPMWIIPHKTCDAALKACHSIEKRLKDIDSPGVDALKFDNDSEVMEIARKGFAEFEVRTLEEFECESVTAPAPEPVVDPEDVKRARYEARIKRQEEADREREIQYKKALDLLRKDIIEAAGEGDENWIRLPICAKTGEYDYANEPSRYLPVPKAPFLNWVYNRSPADRISPGLVPAWTPMSPSGMKMMGDDREHSDWVIGAGLDPALFYEEEEVNMASYRMRHEILSETLNFDIEVFAGSGSCSGKIKHLAPGEVLTSNDEIGVIPTGGMEFDAALRSAVRLKTGIIMLVGGKLCHAAVVGRETDLQLVMWPEASKLRDGERVFISLDNRYVQPTSL